MLISQQTKIDRTKYYYHFLSIDDPATSAIRNNTMKMKNNILAMEAAPAAIPVKPNTAATIATIKKISAQRNMCLSFKLII
jgi:hypothetical protein